MKEKVSKIFKDLKEGKLSFEKAEQQVLDLFDVSQQSELLMSFLDELIEDIEDNNPQLAELRRKKLKELINCA